MVSAINLDNILPLIDNILAENTRKSLESRLWSIWTGFRPKYGSNTIQAQFWDHIWSPLLKAILLMEYKSGIVISFLAFPNIFRICFVRIPKKHFLLIKMAMYCCSHPVARDLLQKPLKNWVRCKMVKYYPRSGSNTIQAQFWDHIWSPLFKTFLLIEYESGIVILFLASTNIFRIRFVRKPKSTFYWRTWQCIAIHIPWHGICSENLEKFGAKWKFLMCTGTITTLVETYKSGVTAQSATIVKNDEAIWH